jgi:hypothetical protein
LISTLRQDFSNIVKAMVDAPIATSGVATWMPTTRANKGMAINASPNPKADRVKVDKNMIPKTSKVVVEKSITISISCIPVK